LKYRQTKAEKLFFVTLTETIVNFIPKNDYGTYQTK
jgi:hypothetical protein